MNRRLISLGAGMVMLASACTGSVDNVEAAPTTTTTIPTETTAPPALAFAEDEPTEPYTLRVSVPEMRFVAPHAVDEANSIEVLITDLLTDGLTDRDPETGEATAGLASTWAASDDRLAWTFFLGEHTFSNGEPIAAADVVESLNRVARMGVDSLSGPLLNVIDGYAAVSSGEVEAMTGVVAIDDTTVQITLTEQYEPLPELLAGVTFGVFPVEIDTTGTLPLSSARDFRPAVMFEDGFRMIADVEPGAVSTIEVFVDDSTSLLDSGAVDMAIGVDPQNVSPTHTTITTPRSAHAFLAMNQAVEPFDDEQLRRAVLMALDREELLDTYFPTATISNGFVLADACGTHCERSIESAESGVASSGASQMEFTVDFFTSGAEDDLEQRMAEAVVSSLRNVGLKATARGHALEDYGTRIGEGDLAMFRFGAVSASLTPDATLAPMFTTTGSDNVSNIADEEIDSLIGEARRTIGSSERNALYAEVETLVFERALVAPLFRFQNHLVLGDTLSDASLDVDGSLDLGSLVFAASP